MHLGYAYNTELENDSFENAQEAIEKALDSDIILVAGDIFDSRSPRHAVWARSIPIFTQPLMMSSNVKLVSSTKKFNQLSERVINSLPVVAIYGNHDRKSKSEINVVESLEHAGLLILLDRDTLIFEKNGERVAIHGMSSVPERFAKSALDEWSPRPVEGCFNILMLHQSIDPYVFSPLEPPSLSIKNLPKGFDLIIDGHIHSRISDNVDGTPFLIPGGTVITQMEKKEAELEKGIFKLAVGEIFEMNFEPLQQNRKFFYEEITTNNETSVRDQIEKRINDIIFTKNLQKPPMVKLKIYGKESEVIDQDLRAIERKYSDKIFLVISKDLESPEMTEKIEFMKNLREQKMSVEEIGLNLFRKNLEELNFQKQFDYETLFSLLSQNAVDKAFSIIVGEQKTLPQIVGRIA